MSKYVDRHTEFIHTDRHRKYFHLLAGGVAPGANVNLIEHRFLVPEAIFLRKL